MREPEASVENGRFAKELISEFAEAYGSFGLNPLMGRIIGLLLVSPEPLSLDEIAHRLEMSKGPISQICRRLKERHLIEKIWVPGDRKDYYRAVDDIFGQAFENQIHKMYRNAEIAHRHSHQTRDSDDPLESFVHGRMKEMAEFYEQLHEAQLAFLESWRASKGSRKS